MKYSGDLNTELFNIQMVKRRLPSGCKMVQYSKWLEAIFFSIGKPDFFVQFYNGNGCQITI